MIEKLKELGFKYIGESLCNIYNVYYHFEKEILIYESNGIYEFADTGEEIQNILNVL
jgi:hypothetical protein